MGDSSSDSRSFITQLVGTQKHANSEIIEQYFIGEIIQNLTDALSNYFISQGISILQANAKLNELSQLTAKAIKMEFDRFGIEVINFNVERINIPEEDMREIQLAQKERMRMKQMQDAKVSNAYISMRTFDTLECGRHACWWNGNRDGYGCWISSWTTNWAIYEYKFTPSQSPAIWQ